jgi:hypothetical protein
MRVFAGELLADEWVFCHQAAGRSGHALLKRESLPAASPQDSFSAVAGPDNLPGNDAPAGCTVMAGYRQ